MTREEANETYLLVKEKTIEGKKMEKLKPCPFCGGEAKIMKMGYPHWVYCLQCGAKVHGGTTSEKDSIKAWNRRTEPKQMFPEWDEERKRRFLSVIRQKLKECANDGRSDDLRS